MKNLWIIFLLGIIGIGVSSCDEDCEDASDPMCPNYDPCLFEEAKSDTDFRIYKAYAGLHTPEFTIDTFFPGSRVYFEANIEDAIRYEWRIGIDTVVTEDKYFSISFNTGDSTLLVSAPVSITLIVEYEPDLECFPNRTGRDSITKLIYFGMPQNAAYFKKWNIYLDGDTNNPYEIEMKMINSSASGSIIYDVGIFNLYNEGNSCMMSLYSGYRLYSFFQLEYSRWQTSCGLKTSAHGMKDIRCRVENENKIYMTWKEVYRVNNEELSISHSLEGYKVD